jgi:hypothetical protein
LHWARSGRGRHADALSPVDIEPAMGLSKPLPPKADYQKIHIIKCLGPKQVDHTPKSVHCQAFETY